MKKILSIVLAVMLVLTAVSAFTASAEETGKVFYVKTGAENGDGTQRNPFGTFDEAITAIGPTDDGTIYVIGTINFQISDIPHEGMITVKGMSKNSRIKVGAQAGVLIYGPMTFSDIVMDWGRWSNFNIYGQTLVIDTDLPNEVPVHLGPGEGVVDTVNYTHNSGWLYAINLGAYSNSYSNGVSGDVNITVNGGEIREIDVYADHYLSSHTGITISGNVNIVINGGTIGKFQGEGPYNAKVEGAVNIICNNGVAAPQGGFWAGNVGQGIYKVYSGEHGKVTPTDQVGVFNVQADPGYTAVIYGEPYENGLVELQTGENEIFYEYTGDESSSNKTIKLTIGSNILTKNGVNSTIDVPAQIINNRTMVPLRAIFEALDASVEWDAATKTVTSVKGNTTVKLTVGVASINVNGVDKALDVPGQIVSNRTLVPARAVAEAFGCDVQWDAATKTVTIVSK